MSINMHLWCDFFLFSFLPISLKFYKCNRKKKHLLFCIGKSTYKDIHLCCTVESNLQINSIAVFILRLKALFKGCQQLLKRAFVSITRAMCDKWKIYDKHIKQHSLPPFFKDWAIKPQHDVFVSLVYILNFPY